MFEPNSTLPNFTFGKFSVARRPIACKWRSYQADRPLVVLWHTFWRHNILSTCFDVLILLEYFLICDVMAYVLTYFVTSWHIFIMWRTFWRHDVRFYVITYFFTSGSTSIWRHGVLLDITTYHDVRTSHTFWRNDIPFDNITYFLTSFYVMKYFLWHSFGVMTYVLTYSLHTFLTLWRFV